MNSFYGSYRTRKFTDIFKNVTEFINGYTSNGIPPTIHYGEIWGSYQQPENAQTLYYLLYARYGNSHICNADENQFKYKVWATIYQYGPTWEKNVEVQKMLRDLSITDIEQGAKIIYNKAFNNGSEPKTTTKTELDYINEQNVTNYQRNKLDAYGNLMALLRRDVTEEFLSKFRNLFNFVASPQDPLWYETSDEEEEEEDQ